MSYTPGVPQSGTSLGQTRDPILTNFTLINQAFGSNHVPLTTNATGLHTHVDMTAQAADPATPSPIVSHYSKQVGGITEWFFKREAPGNEVIRMSRGTPIPLATGYSFLPGGILIQWGNISVPYINPISYSVPFTTAVFSVQLTGNTSTAPFVGAIGLANFQAFILIAPGSAATWIAIGV